MKDQCSDTFHSQRQADLKKLDDGVRTVKENIIARWQVSFARAFSSCVEALQAGPEDMDALRLRMTDYPFPTAKQLGLTMLADEEELHESYDVLVKQYPMQLTIAHREALSSFSVPAHSMEMVDDSRLHKLIFELTPVDDSTWMKEARVPDLRKHTTTIVHVHVTRSVKKQIMDAGHIVVLQWVGCVLQEHNGPAPSHGALHKLSSHALEGCSTSMACIA